MKMLQKLTTYLRFFPTVYSFERKIIFSLQDRIVDSHAYNLRSRDRNK